MRSSPRSESETVNGHAAAVVPIVCKVVPRGGFRAYSPPWAIVAAPNEPHLTNALIPNRHGTIVFRGTAVGDAVLAPPPMRVDFPPFGRGAFSRWKHRVQRVTPTSPDPDLSRKTSRFISARCYWNIYFVRV